MTMTDTEAKALALVNEACKSDFKDLGATYRNNILDALLLAIERLEATEARHAAELREQAERFSEALKRYYGDDVCPLHPILAPFILPKPDPLESVVEQVALELGITGASSLHTVRADDFRKKLIAALRAQQKDTNA